jgi:thiosulfate/3-mercaptopyruvate sulfurtransferase
MGYTTLISTDDLAAHLDDGWAIVDCRYDLKDERWGAGLYRAAHVPGAVYASLSHDLSAPPGATNGGRHPLPPPAAMAATFGRFGIGAGTQVVLYDQDAGSWAARMWWMLRYMGHDAAAVLDGGFAKWQREGHLTRAGEETRAAAPFTGRPRPEMRVEVDEVERRLADGSSVLIDARAPERFDGSREPLDSKGGHIPGALNHFFRTNLADDGTMTAPATLHERFTALLGGRRPDEAVMYCGSGVTACHNLLAMEHAGVRGSKLYVGSWSEWSSDPARPVATGPGKSQTPQPNSQSNPLKADSVQPHRRMPMLRLLFLTAALAVTAVTDFAAQSGSLSCDDNFGNGRRRVACDIREETLAGVSMLNVEASPNGGIQVRGWDRRDTLVRYKVTAWARSDEAARQLASQVRVSTAGGRVEADGPPRDDDGNWAVSFELQVPREGNLTLNTRNGGITIEDFRGTARFDARNGGISLFNVGGDIRGETVNGGVNVDLAGSRWDGAGLDVETRNGGVRMRLPDNYSAQLETGTVNGRMRVDFPVTVQGRLPAGRNRSLSTTLGAGGPLIRVRTTNGGVTISRR